MKQTLTTLLLVLCISFVQKTQAQTAWVKQNIDEKVAVKFPAAPEAVDAGQAKVYRYLAPSDSTAYTANFTDFESFGLDSATLAGMSGTEEFANQFKTAFAGQIPGLKMTKLDIGKWKDYTSYDIEGEVQEKKVKVYVKCIFIGSKVYSLFCATSPKSDIKNKDSFLSSFELL